MSEKIFEKLIITIAIAAVLVIIVYGKIEHAKHESLQKQEYFLDGKRAQKSGLSILHNPHPEQIEGGQPFQSWNNGWLDSFYKSKNNAPKN